MTIQSMKIAPHLFVGLGGCGSQIVNEIARKLRRREEEFERYKNLVHFFTFDTDMGELKRCDAVDHWIPISQFDKREFVELGFGQRGAPEDELFTSWWPEYYQPRATTGAGAGQIRIESRLSIYRTLKAMPQYLTTMRNAVRQCYDAHERWRDTDKNPMIHIYASLAGGTGSGAFLTLAYLLRDLVAAHQNPIVVGTFVLPAVFKGMGLPSQQIDKIMANGYAALMELEYLQGATDTPSGRIRFQYNPNAKEPQYVTHGPFNQVYLVDDVSQVHSVLSNPTQIYPHLADAAYTQIFTDIIERDQSTADNDEREIAVTDENHYTKRFGSFGLSVLVLPDEDILEYVATRYAADAIDRAFALTGEGQGGQDRGGGRALTPEQRDQSFIREVHARSRLPGDTGEFYQRAEQWVEGGGDAGTGALAEILRRMEVQLQRLDAITAGLPRIGEEWLLEFEDAPDEVRVQLNRRFEAWNDAAARAKEDILAEGRLIGTELAGEAHDHSLGKLTDGVGALRVRLLLIRLEQALRQRQSAADATLRQAQGAMQGWQDRYHNFVATLAAAAPKTFLERFTGNDYLQEVPVFVNWFRGTVYDPQRAALRADAELELYDALLEALGERREKLAALFDQLNGIRHELLERCDELLEHGVPRDEGGLSTEHMLDVEVYENHLVPETVREWNVLYRRLVRPDHFSPDQIARTIQAAQDQAEGRRQLREAVSDALVQLGRDTFRQAIVGEHEPQSMDQMGLTLWDGLREDARIAWAWKNLKRLYDDIEDIPEEELQQAMKEVSDQRVNEYIREKLALAARKCAPFWRLSEGATKLSPKRYVTVFSGYLDDQEINAAFNKIHGFDAAKPLQTGDPKRVVFYWNQMGVPVYRVQSVNEYGNHYQFVKQDELRRGPIYRRSELRYTSGRPEFEAQAAAAEGQRCPDVPLHTERDWEGAPDETHCLFPIDLDAITESRGKVAWEKACAEREQTEVQQAQVEERADIRAFALCRVLGLIVKQDDHYVWTLEEIKNESDRKLGRFLDEAFESFTKTREAIRRFAEKRVAQRLEELERDRLRETIDGLFNPHLEALEVAILNAGQREGAILRDEQIEVRAELDRLLSAI